MADTFSIRLPDDLKAEVERIAEATNRSRAYVVKEAVEAYVADHRAYLAALEEAIKDADKGTFVSGDAVFTWLEELKSDPKAAAPAPDIFKK